MNNRDERERATNSDSEKALADTSRKTGSPTALDPSLVDWERTLHLFLNQSPALTFVKDPQGRYLHVNDQFIRAFGLSRAQILGRTDAEIFAPEQAAQFVANDASVLAARMPIEVEETARYLDGLHTSLVAKFPVLEADGHLLALGGIATDITSRKRMEASLVESRTLLTEAQKLAQLGCWQWEAESGQVSCSDEMYRIFDVERHGVALTYATVLARVLEADRPMLMQIMADLLQSKQSFTAELRVMGQDAQLRHIRASAVALHDESGRVHKVVGICQDITEHKQAAWQQQQLAEQLQQLSRRMVQIQEQERRDLSREFHDCVGQNLTALSINLNILKQQLAGSIDQDIMARLEDSAALIDDTAGMLDNILADLRPQMLDDYGLRPALHWLATTFARRTGIEIEVAPGNDPAPRPSGEVEIALFRIAQEALNNAAKHAQAKRIVITLRHAEQSFLLTIIDDGIGFDTHATTPTDERKGYGMATMRERAQSLGGDFTVKSAKKQGTHIVAWVPLRPR